MTGVGFTDFYDASTARSIAMGGSNPLGVILTEINAIKIGIDGAIPSGGLSLTVTNSTTMTSSATYYEAWTDPALYVLDAHKLARARMDAVVMYFSRLGYDVRRQREGTNNRFQWVIAW